MSIRIRITKDHSRFSKGEVLNLQNNIALYLLKNNLAVVEEVPFEEETEKKIKAVEKNANLFRSFGLEYKDSYTNLQVREVLENVKFKKKDSKKTYCKDCDRETFSTKQGVNILCQICGNPKKLKKELEIE